MKKLYLIAFLIVLTSFIVYAANDLSDYPNSLSGKEVVVVVGDEAPATDVLATLTITQGIKNDINIVAESALVSEIASFSNHVKILIGNPCDNKLIVNALNWDDCSQWPYRSGEALIQTYDQGIIVAGSTQDDTRMGANALAEHKDLSGVKIVIQGDKENFITTDKIRERKEPEPQPECSKDEDCYHIRCPWVGCENEKCSCGIREPLQSICDGCLIGEEQCVNYGIRMNNQYCSVTEKQFVDQKPEKSNCDNDFECSSNFCVDNECISGNLLRRIINWFKALFGA